MGGVCVQWCVKSGEEYHHEIKEDADLTLTLTVVLFSLFSHLTGHLWVCQEFLTDLLHYLASGSLTKTQRMHG